MANKRVKKPPALPQTPYAVLGVGHLCTADEVKQAYYRQIRTQHPDANNGTVGPLYQALTTAWSALGTDVKRAQWWQVQRFLSGKCTVCQGYGVAGQYKFSTAAPVCAACNGMGRTL